LENTSKACVYASPIRNFILNVSLFIFPALSLIKFIIPKNSENEIGCVHSVQGIDINCVGLIIGKDLIYREGKVIANLKEYCDKYGRTDNIDELTGLIKNIYYVLATRGVDGIRIYIEDKELRNHFMRTLGIKKMK